MIHRFRDPRAGDAYALVLPANRLGSNHGGLPVSGEPDHDASLADLLNDRPRQRDAAAPAEAPQHHREPAHPVAEVTFGRLHKVRVAGGFTVDVTAGAGAGLDSRSRAAAASPPTWDRPPACHRVRRLLPRADRARPTTMDIRLSGANHVKVQTEQTIAAQLSGASGLTDKGQPAVHQAGRVGMLDYPARLKAKPSAVDRLTATGHSRRGRRPYCSGGPKGLACCRSSPNREP